MSGKNRKGLLAKTLPDALSFIYRYKVEIFCLVMVWSAIYLSLTAANTKNIVTTRGRAVTPGNSQSTIPIAIISQNVAQWVKNQKGPNTVYNYDTLCTSAGCTTPYPGGRVGLTAIWVYFNDYLINKNANDLTEINELLSYYNYWGPARKPFMMQNIFYNCKWMSQMAQSNYFSPEQKVLIRNICLSVTNGYNPSFQSSSEIAQWKDKFSQTQILTSKQGVIQNYRSKVASSSTEEDLFIKLSAFASDFSYKYLLDSSKSVYLDLARAYFNKAFGYWNTEATGNFYYGKCVFGTAATDLYKITNDNTYLTFAKNLIEKEQLLNGCQPDNNYCFGSTFEKATCSLLAKDLYKLTGLDSYKQMRNIFNSQLMSNLDLINYGYKYGYGSFWNKQGTDFFYSIRDNGLALEARREE